MLTQRELELECYGFGMGRAANRIGTLEEQGAADQTPYANAVYKEYVGPLAEAMDQIKIIPKDGKLEAYAYVAVRATLIHLMSRNGDDARRLIKQVGKAIYHEHLLEHFSELDPYVFNVLCSGRGKNLYGGDKYRLDVFIETAKDCSLPLDYWDDTQLDHAGSRVVDALADLGMVSIESVSVGVNNSRLVCKVGPQAGSLIEQITTAAVENSTHYLACVEQPKDWVNHRTGGWHTDEMRRLMPSVIHNKASRSELDKADLSQELAAINALQRTAWRINSAMLDKLEIISKHIGAEEIGTSTRLLKQVLSVAHKFLEYPELYFVYFADFRGRKYAMGSGINPQGSDISKCLLHFAEAKPLKDKAARDWFMITGANLFGYDKVSLADRVQWSLDNAETILANAEDPVANRQWLEASSPLQYLAWCLEYRDHIEQGPAFVSRISCGMDGTCNGLQHFSAMLRDSVGGKATNLIPASAPSDIYGIVGKRTQSILEARERDGAGIVQRWVDHGINRSIVKRGTMTMPYNSTRYSCAEFVRQDYLSKGKAPEFGPKEHAAAAQLLSLDIWAAIGEVVVKAREAMDWLKGSAQSIVKQGNHTISWTTPTGFPVHQVYFVTEVKNIRTKLCGRATLKVYSDGKKADAKRHANGLSPNFVHSMDASHLTDTVNRCHAQGIRSFHMIHDSYGTHCADAQQMFETLRQSFVEMYTNNNPLQDLADAYGIKTPVPTPGDLDLTQVNESLYFFS